MAYKRMCFFNKACQCDSECLKEEKEQAQPQLSGTWYFSVRIALTGPIHSLACAPVDARAAAADRGAFQ
jgi:hypothetical protein